MIFTVTKGVLMEILTPKEMCARLRISEDTFRKKWRSWKHEKIGQGSTLRSYRFYWQDGPIRAEGYEDGNLEVSYSKRRQMDRRSVSGWRAHRPQIRLHDQTGSESLGDGDVDLRAEAHRLGFV